MEADHPHLYHEEFLTAKGRVVVWKPVADPSNKNNSRTRKQLERQAVVKMLHALGHPVANLHYKESGQPMLAPDSKAYLSVSHAQGWFALYVATEPVGIDIEPERPAIGKGKSWFINPAELPKHKTVHDLHLVWGAKEAYYKKREGQIADLCSDVTVQEIGREKIIVSHAGHETEAFYKVIGDVYLVWV